MSQTFLRFIWCSKWGRRSWGSSHGPQGSWFCWFWLCACWSAQLELQLFPVVMGPVLSWGFSHFLSESCGGRAVWELQAFTTATLVSWRKTRVFTQPKTFSMDQRELKKRWVMWNWPPEITGLLSWEHLHSVRRFSLGTFLLFKALFCPCLWTVQHSLCPWSPQVALQLPPAATKWRSWNRAFAMTRSLSPWCGDRNELKELHCFQGIRTSLGGWECDPIISLYQKDGRLVTQLRFGTRLAVKRHILSGMQTIYSQQQSDVIPVCF